MYDAKTEIQCAALKILAYYCKLMTSFTDGAKSKIKKILELHPNAKFLRFGIKSGGCIGFKYDISIEYNDARPNDIILTYNGVSVIIDGKSALFLAETEIDYKQSLMEDGFKFNNLEVDKSCSCGNSFSIKQKGT